MFNLIEIIILFATYKPIAIISFIITIYTITKFTFNLIKFFVNCQRVYKLNPKWKWSFHKLSKQDCNVLNLWNNNKLNLSLGNLIKIVAKESGLSFQEICINVQSNYAIDIDRLFSIGFLIDENRRGTFGGQAPYLFKKLNPNMFQVDN